MKRALITGITGQDGSYLAALLLEKGYEVHGVVRRGSTSSLGRLEPLLAAPAAKRLTLHRADMTDGGSLLRVVRETRPDELYNLAAQSDVAASFDQPELTADVGALGALRLLEAVRILGLERRTRFYQASTSEMYGACASAPQREDTPFAPVSPYGVSKVFAYWMTAAYRRAYGMYACNGILFNHESPVRGADFVTRKITRGLARVKLGLEDRLQLGNLDAKRDWGHARDYVEMQWRMLQQKRPDDYVIATGEPRSVREFVKAAARLLGLPLRWKGRGGSERGVTEDGRTIVEVSGRYQRPTDVARLVGDSRKARAKLGWKPRASFEQLVEEMVREDLRLAELEAAARARGLTAGRAAV